MARPTTRSSRAQGGQRPEIRERRKRASLTQRQLAQLADCSLATVANFEAGLIPKSSQALGRIIAALDLIEAGGDG